MQSKLSDIPRTEFQEILQKKKEEIFHFTGLIKVVKKKKTVKRDLKVE